MKRSSQVALLLMGTVAVGGSAYALMPSENCQPNQPGMAQTGTQTTQCAPRSSSSSSYSGSGYRSSSSGYGSSSSSSAYLSSQTGNTSSGGSSHGDHGVARGGFGSFASHFSGGG